MLKSIQLLVILLTPFLSYSQNFKIRAREHYEFHKVRGPAVKSDYKGLANTINFWWEKPYDLYYGFSFSSFFSNLEGQNADLPLGEKIQFYNIGLELKYFPKYLIQNLYLRPGLTYSILKPDQLFTEKTGYALYLGIGYEYPFEILGMALEVGFRHAQFQDNYEINSVIPSIGFHFYKHL